MTASQWTSLLAASEPLHQDDSSNLSLKQLVSVHESLIKALSTGGGGQTFSSLALTFPVLDADGCLQKILLPGIETSEETVFEKQLILAWQYVRTFLSPEAVLPSLLEVLYSQRSCTTQFLDAILQWTVTSENSILSPESITTLVKVRPVESWARTCRIFKHILEVSGPIDACADMVVNVLKELAADEKTPLDLWLRPLSLDLLPLMLPGALDSLWQVSGSLFVEEQFGEVRRLTIITTVLCQILPSILEHGDEVKIWDTETVMPLRDHKLLWKLVHSCLNLGLAIPRRNVSSMIVTDERPPLVTADAEMLRRRGLFLLQRLCENMDDKDWKTYVACLETLEMESQVHLLDQVWGHVAKLTKIDYSWMCLLWRRAWSHQKAIIRKACVYHATSGQAGIVIPSQNGKGFPLERLDASIMTDLISCYDSLDSPIFTVGKKHVKSFRLKEMIEEVLHAYARTAPGNEVQRLLELVWDVRVCGWWHRKTTITVWQMLAGAIRKFEVTADLLDRIVDGFDRMTRFGGTVISHKNMMLKALSRTLSLATMPDKMPPLSLLNVLALYEFPELSEIDGIEDVAWIASDESWVALATWLKKMDNPEILVRSTCMAYVSGMLPKGIWDIVEGTSALDQRLGRALALLAALVTDGVGAGELLWPAIHKGLSCVSLTLATDHWSQADVVARALVLLEGGCMLQILSGMGNGALVMDRRNNMMPPPPSIENMLTSAVQFVLNHLDRLLPGSRSGVVDGDPNHIIRTYARLVSQMLVFYKSYPSSAAIAASIEKNLSTSLNAVYLGPSAEHMGLLYATLSGGAQLDSSTDLKKATEKLIQVELIAEVSSFEMRTMRTLFEYGRWGSLGMLLPQLFAAEEGPSSQEVLDICVRVFESARDAIEVIPSEGYTPLFNTIMVAANYHFGSQHARNMTATSLKYLSQIMNTLIELMQSRSGSQQVYMLDEICAFIFSKDLVEDESRRLRENEAAFDPVRETYRKLIKIAGTKKGHVAKAVLCRVSASWLGSDHSLETSGLAAVPYVDDLLQLLIHKMDRADELATTQVVYEQPHGDGVAKLPDGTDDLSVARGFALGFLASLPSPKSGLHPEVQTKLLQPLILKLLEKTMSRSVNLYMRGTPEYCVNMRAWQALCVCSRFVTNDIAEEVCEHTFKAMAENMHNQMRYFLEVFTLQCAKSHPAIFGGVIVREISRVDLSLQQVSSLMIISGNLIVGRLNSDFFRQYAENDKNSTPLADILSATIPWLSSTQGFSRAIAQLLVHHLIPLVIDVKSEPSGTVSDSNWYLLSIYRFLENNIEMSRVRKKQSKFFQTYDIDSVCTPEGVFGIPLDDGREANPPHLVEVVKECLREVYAEAHPDFVPHWKQVAAAVVDNGIQGSESDDVNFQRKIIPLDALNLAMEDVRDRRSRNIAGRRKQPLIVCASLIDKVPNLGGLARTAEIFAADRLMIPDLKVTRQDDFRSLCVSAQDWIELEECPPTALAQRLYQLRSQGYFIVGIEQTSSSKNLTRFSFPDCPVVLLLGKEREGIPLEFLQVVDQCVEIPQLGIIRSLNVHVSGAIAIWEFTRQRFEAGHLQ